MKGKGGRRRCLTADKVLLTEWSRAGMGAPSLATNGQVNVGKQILLLGGVAISFVQGSFHTYLGQLYRGLTEKRH